MKDSRVQAEYNEGQRFESIVMNYLVSCGYEVKKSTIEEDRSYDIDFWYRKNSNMKWTSASLKTNQPRYFSSPFCFEQKQVRRGKMVDSWWNTGKADMYFVLKRDRDGGAWLWQLSKKALQQHVQEYGWCADNVGISDERLAMQALNNMGNSVLGLIKQETVKARRLGVVFGVIDKLENYEDA